MIGRQECNAAARTSWRRQSPSVQLDRKEVAQDAFLVSRRILVTVQQSILEVGFRRRVLILEEIEPPDKVAVGDLLCDAATGL